jgi:hypothetical protein
MFMILYIQLKAPRLGQMQKLSSYAQSVCEQRGDSRTLPFCGDTSGSKMECVPVFHSIAAILSHQTLNVSSLDKPWAQRSSAVPHGFLLA